MLPVWSRRPGGPSATPTSTSSPTRSPSAARPRRRRGRCGGAVPRHLPRPRGRLRRLRQDRCHLRRRQPAPDRTASATPCSSGLEPTLIARTPSWSGDGPDTVLAPLRAAGAAPPPLDARPRPPRRHRLHLGHHRAAQGCGVHRTASSRSSPRSTRACAGAAAAPAMGSTSLAHLGPDHQAARHRSCAAGTTFLVERWRAGDALAHDRRAPHGRRWPASPPSWR